MRFRENPPMRYFPRGCIAWCSGNKQLARSDYVEGLDLSITIWSEREHRSRKVGCWFESEEESITRYWTGIDWRRRYVGKQYKKKLIRAALTLSIQSAHRLFSGLFWHSRSAFCSFFSRRSADLELLILSLLPIRVCLWMSSWESHGLGSRVKCSTRGNCSTSAEPPGPTIFSVSSSTIKEHQYVLLSPKYPHSDIILYGRLRRGRMGKSWNVLCRVPKGFRITFEAF